MMEITTPDMLTSLNIFVLVSQKQHLEEQALLEGLAAPSEYLRQLIREDQQRKAQEELERMLVKAIESDQWIEGTPEHWTKMHAKFTTQYGHATNSTEE